MTRLFSKEEKLRSQKHLLAKLRSRDKKMKLSPKKIKDKVNNSLTLRTSRSPSLRSQLINKPQRVKRTRKPSTGN